MSGRRPPTRILALGVLAFSALAAACAPSAPAPGPVWWVTVERGAAPVESERDLEAVAVGAARFPGGHAVSPELGDQWVSLWTGYWPRTLEGGDLGRVPSLFRDLRRAGRELRAWLPALSPESRESLEALGLPSPEERPRGRRAGLAALRGDWAAAEERWRAWCEAGTAGLVWVHLDANEASLLPELLAGTLGRAPAGQLPGALGPGRLWIVELGRPAELQQRADAPAWERLADLEERRLATRAWGWGAGLESSDRGWCSHDLAATLAASLGLSEPFTEDQGRSLLAPDPGFRVLVAEQRGATHRRTVAWVGGLKLWRAAQPRGSGAEPWEGDHPRLFDWVGDPEEFEDLGPGNADRVLQLERVVRLWEDQRRIRRRAAQRLGWLVPAGTAD